MYCVALQLERRESFVSENVSLLRVARWEAKKGEGSGTNQLLLQAGEMWMKGSLRVWTGGREQECRVWLYWCGRRGLAGPWDCLVGGRLIWKRWWCGLSE